MFTHKLWLLHGSFMEVAGLSDDPCRPQLPVISSLLVSAGESLVSPVRRSWSWSCRGTFQDCKQLFSALSTCPMDKLPYSELIESQAHRWCQLQPSAFCKPLHLPQGTLLLVPWTSHRSRKKTWGSVPYTERSEIKLSLPGSHLHTGFSFMWWI